MRYANDQVAYCWGTTKYACESGFARVPFVGDDDWFETSTQMCGRDADINQCYAADEWCTIADCNVELTMVYLPLPPSSPPLSPPQSIRLSANGYQNCGLKWSDDTVECWGKDTHGRTTPIHNATYSSIAVGGWFGCVVE